jgi:hypothetical protein
MPNEPQATRVRQELRQALVVGLAPGRDVFYAWPSDQIRWGIPARVEMSGVYIRPMPDLDPDFPRALGRTVRQRMALDFEIAVLVHAQGMQHVGGVADPYEARERAGADIVRTLGYARSLDCTVDDLEFLSLSYGSSELDIVQGIETLFMARALYRAVFLGP